ncbi:hypothetical protein MB02_03590 [Croceicoccus estronivorus]|uniref:PEP-CTERM sorting domain-containing protein n=1 Tax=Croceicoccus estronivorus TaxID=1172626 RepID=UPI00082E50A0|nr:PEP-CTERM sorting domain-containing protein [Croceicoccus estronivorus]OCC24584.1 hypothetical protein MB02_03590 [Croceicoccus estronivorus]
MKKTLLALGALGTVAIASPAMATFGSWGGSSGGWSSHKHYCGCGDRIGDSQCGGSTTSGSSTTTSTTSTSSGNEVPEPGMLGMAAAGLIGLAALRRRKALGKA